MKMLYAFSLGGDYKKENVCCFNDSEALTQKEEDFCKTLVEGVQHNEDQLRMVISEFSQGWNLDRIGKVELAILLIATYELMFLPEVPTGASINEAVELSKAYCDEKSPAFINGILGTIGRKYRS